MNNLMFCAASVVLFALGALCIHRTDPSCGSGGPEYEMRRFRRLIGNLVFFLAALVLGIGVIAVAVSDN